VLLLRVGYNKNTSFHLAEYLSLNPRKRIVHDGVPVIVLRSRVWRATEDILYDDCDFEPIGREFEKDHGLAAGAAPAAWYEPLRQSKNGKNPYSSMYRQDGPILS
jgi:aminoglycoside 3-N-acetyltransferase